MTPVTCMECTAQLPGTRAEARRLGWEPFSSSSQWALDEGPMVCSDCIGRLLDSVQTALVEYVRIHGWGDEHLELGDSR